MRQEIERVSIIGPFIKNPFGKQVRISPLDTRPKKDSDELRVILNLSHPFESGSVNHSINKETYAGGEEMNLKYPSMDDLASLINRKGRSAKNIYQRFTKSIPPTLDVPRIYTFAGIHV